jgi:hypothetical protein
MDFGGHSGQRPLQLLSRDAFAGLSNQPPESQSQKKLQYLFPSPRPVARQKIKNFIGKAVKNEPGHEPDSRPKGQELILGLIGIFHGLLRWAFLGPPERAPRPSQGKTKKPFPVKEKAFSNSTPLEAI